MKLCSSLSHGTVYENWKLSTLPFAAGQRNNPIYMDERK